MALVIALVNKSNLAEKSDYEAMVYINRTPIAGPFKVKGHNRSDGWEKLVKKFARSLKVNPAKGQAPSRSQEK